MTDVPNHGQSREDWDAYYLEVSRLAAARAAVDKWGQAAAERDREQAA